MKKSLLAKIAGVVLSTGIVVGTIGAVCATKGFNVFDRSVADANTLVLNSANSPVLTDGSATRVDDKNVTWEYSNASDYVSGHVTLNHQGYFGIASSSVYGYTGISNITANFTNNGNSELWLLRSTDGINWGETKILESGVPTALNHGWRYFRLYNYFDSVDIDSVSVGYSCSGVSSTEDVDGAKASNVIATSSNLSYTAEYVDISPLSDGGEAIKFNKDVSGNSDITLGFGETYTIGEIQNYKLEFDMKTSNINYGKSVCLMKNTTVVGSNIFSQNTNAYKCTNIQDDWYHIEVPITAFISTISGIMVDGKIKDKPHSNVEKMEVNGIKINAGTCVIDNLKISGTQCSLGIFNSPTYKPSVGEEYWLKVAWVGTLHAEQVTMTFSDSSMARHIPVTDPNLQHGSPFYLEWLASGTCTVTCTVVSGYNRAVHTIDFTVTVN